MNIDQAIKDMKQSVNKEVSPKEVTAIQETPKEVIEVEDKKIGRPTKVTEAMQKRLVKLAEELFFIRSVAGEADLSVDTIERHLQDDRFKPFALLYTHALNKFIAHHQRLLMEYSKDKKMKDWRAEAHILTLCDKEFSERKYLTEAVSNQDAKILLMIKAEQLTIAGQQGQEMLKTVNPTPLQPNKISLLPFNTNKVEKSINKGKKKKTKAKKVSV